VQLRSVLNEEEEECQPIEHGIKYDEERDNWNKKKWI